MSGWDDDYESVPAPSSVSTTQQPVNGGYHHQNGYQANGGNGNGFGSNGHGSNGFGSNGFGSQTNGHSSRNHNSSNSRPLNHRGQLSIEKMPVDTTISKIREIFGRYGKISRIVCDHKFTEERLYCYLDYEDPSFADTALRENGRIMDKGAILVKKESEENRGSGGFKRDSSGRGKFENRFGDGDSSFGGPSKRTNGDFGGERNDFNSSRNGGDRRGGSSGRYGGGGRDRQSDRNDSRGSNGFGGGNGHASNSNGGDPWGASAVSTAATCSSAPKTASGLSAAADDGW